MFLTGFIICLKKVLTISYGFIKMFHLPQSRCLWFSMVQQSLFRLPRIRSRWFNHGFLTNIIAYFQQNRYVWFAICWLIHFKGPLACNIVFKQWKGAYYDSILSTILSSVGVTSCFNFVGQGAGTSEPYQKSKMELFVKIVNGFWN